MRIHHLAAALVSISIGLVAATVRAQGAPAAQAHVDAALAAYNAKDYATAIREFEKGYALDPNPALLYATAQAYRFAGDCKTAVELYEKYLASGVTAVQTEAVRVGIAACEDASKRAPADPPPPPPEVTPEQPAPSSSPVDATAPVTPPPAREARPWYTDALGGALSVGGVTGIGIGIGLFVMANRSERASQDAEFRDDFIRALEQTSSRRRLGAISLAAGSVLAAGGIAVYVFRARGSQPVVAATDGQSLYLAGSF